MLCQTSLHPLQVTMCASKYDGRGSPHKWGMRALKRRLWRTGQPLRRRLVERVHLANGGASGRGKRVA